MLVTLNQLGDDLIKTTKSEDILAGQATLAPIAKDKKELILTCSSDRGLCGAIHSSVSKLTRFLAKENKEGCMVAVLGDKAKPQVARDARKSIKISFAGVGRNIPVMLDAISVLETIKKTEIKPDSFSIIYNQFQSVISYIPTLVNMPSVAQLKAAPKMSAYEVSDEVLENYADFLLASRLYWALVEGHAAEMAAKRTAMENASKNAGEISLGLQMQYNRTRQAVITNELVDIITGASAL
jgi:F-type H+-transporting ATPase subunit gamma